LQRSRRRAEARAPRGALDARTARGMRRQSRQSSSARGFGGQARRVRRARYRHAPLRRRAGRAGARAGAGDRALAHAALRGTAGLSRPRPALRSMAERRAAIQAACDQVVLTKALLEKAKIPCPIVTGAGSGSFMFEVETGAWNEIQPGSYVFMDADYARNEWAAPLPRFEHSLFVLATVMSRPAPDRAIVDAGLKASSVDSGMPGVWHKPGLVYAAASDEHGR